MYLRTAQNVSTSFLGSMTTPLSMIFIGVTLAKVDFRSVFANNRLWLTTLVRLVVQPILAYYLILLISRSQTLALVTALLLGLPVAALTSIFAEKYGADVELASQLVFLSTVVIRTC